ncbi:nucleoporin complex subunit 54-domain-containing protein [Russula compacta]|nr:nucleoporin complex subunit 54-domain-containing protein [Russula compacta]
MSTFGGGGGVFGGPGTTQQQPGQSGGLFGNLGSSSTNTGTGTGTSIPNTQPSLFGSQPSTTSGQTSGPGLFGGSNTGTQQTGGGLFGGGTTTGAQNQPAGVGHFGSGGTTPQNQPSTAGSSLFGNTATTTLNQPQPQPHSLSQPQMGGGGSLFGSGSTTTQNQPQTGGGLFGSSGGGGGGGGGLFGSTTTGTTTGQTSGSGPGAQPATQGSLFGSSATASQGQGTSGMGTMSLFGGQQQQQQQQPSGGLFGNTGASTATQPAGSLFGGTTTTQQPTTGGGLFGSSTTTTQQPPATGGGLFGSSTAQQQPATSGGLFGSTTTQHQPLQLQQLQPPAVGGGGLFASSATQPGQQPGSGTLFGSSTTPSTSLFSGVGAGTIGTAAPPNLFGGQVTQPSSSGLLSGSTLGTGGLFSTKNSFAPAQNQADPQVQFTQLQQRIEAILGAWNPTSPLNRFQHYFYNLVDPSQVHFYGRPANATDESLWQKAVRENPDPTCLVPVLATSFDDLQRRVEAQTQQATGHQEKLKEIRARIEKLSERHVLANAPRLQKLGSAQAQLSHRLLRLVQHLHLLIPALRSSSIRPEEEALRAALEEIDGEIRRPGGMGRIVGKLNELWALVGAVNAMRGASSKGSTDGVEWAVVDDEGLNQIVQILGEEQAGLTHLTKILRRDLRDIGVIYGEEVTEEGPGLELLRIEGGVQR